MLNASIPSKFNIPFANSAGPSFTNPIPQASQIGINAGRASLTDGFVPLNFTPLASGGVPPFGADFNGLLNQVTGWSQWQSAGGYIPYDSTFATGSGGYPKNAIIGSNVVPGNFYMSTADNNTTDPDSLSSANWVPAPGLFNTGDIKWRATSTAQSSWVIKNGTTIGNSGSGASQLTSSTALLIYRYLWSSFSNTQCPVTGGRGANADADFAANKPIGTLNMQAIHIMGVDGMGGTPTNLLNNVPIVSGSATLASSIVGENLHQLITAELASHNHAKTDPGHTHTTNAASAAQAFGVGTGAQDVPVALAVINSAVTGITISSTGSDTPHNNVPRSMLGYWFMKL